jgi:hypothetical protein
MEPGKIHSAEWILCRSHVFASLLRARGGIHKLSDIDMNAKEVCHVQSVVYRSPK